MSAYLIFNYEITNAEEYAAYPRAAMPTMAASGAEVLVADYESEAREGSPGKVTVVLRFDSRDAALGWYESSEYQAAMKLRTANSTGSVVLCEGFAPSA